MNIDEKVRFGILAVGGASLLLTAIGLHVSPLEQLSGAFEL
jgi:hypothetical protein